MKRLTKNQIKRIKKLKMLGLYAGLIAKKLNISRQTVNYHTLEAIKNYQKNYLKGKKSKEYFKNYNIKNRKKLSEKNKKYRRKNKKTVLKKERAYRRKNKDRINKRNRERSREKKKLCQHK